MLRKLKIRNHDKLSGRKLGDDWWCYQCSENPLYYRFRFGRGWYRNGKWEEIYWITIGREKIRRDDGVLCVNTTTPLQTGLRLVPINGISNLTHAVLMFERILPSVTKR